MGVSDSTSVQTKLEDDYFTQDMATEIQDIFDLAQHNSGIRNHKKCLKSLHNVYKNKTFDDFLSGFMHHLLQAFAKDISNTYATSVLRFASLFCNEIVTEYERHMSAENENGEYEPHPFFQRLVYEVLKYVPFENSNIRYHACEFIALLLGSFGTNIAINDIICDRIQKALLDRITDSKLQIRTQAIKALVRLQNPYDANCPVIHSFIEALHDPVASVRILVIGSIAPCQTTFDHIVCRLRDVEQSVRCATFTRLSKISPKSLTIVYRQSIIMNGILETNPMAKKTFEQLLLPKWLNAYESNIIAFMGALKLDANIEDVNQTDLIYERILPIIFKMTSLEELIQLLGDDDKLIPINDLTVEKVSYWDYFIDYLASIDTSYAEFDNVIPSLTVFVTYIDSFIKFRSQKSMEYWEYLEYQQIIKKLFKLLSRLDKSDEFGRQSMEKLIVSVLTNIKLEQHVMGVIIKVFHTIEPSVDKLAYEICLITNEIKDPFKAVEPPMEMTKEHEFQIAQLNVKLHLLTDEMKNAVEQQQYEMVDQLSRKGENLKKQLAELKMKYCKQPEPVKQPQNNMEPICRCLDIVAAFMENVHIEKLPPSLITFKEEFFQNQEIDENRCGGFYYKIFKLICLYAILDKDMAVDKLEVICTPILAYRVSPVFEKKILTTALGAVSDLMRLHGPDIFNSLQTKQGNKNISKKRGNDRTLYCEDDLESEVESLSIHNVTSGDVIDIMLSILDDSNPEIRETVAIALSKLVVRGLCVSSSLITRLFLKWFNPALDTDDKHDQIVQQYLGTALSKYFHSIKNSFTVLENAIIPTLRFIGNAPNTSPLSDIDYDDTLHCLIQFTRIREDLTLNVHKNLAYSILNHVVKFEEPSIQILAKMLTFLDIPLDEPNVIKELSQQVGDAINNVVDKSAIIYLKKYFNKLNGIISKVDDSATLDGTNKSSRTSTTPAKGRRSKLNSNTTPRKTISDTLPTIEETSDGTTSNNSIQAVPSSSRKRRGKSSKSGSDVEENNTEISGERIIHKSIRNQLPGDLDVIEEQGENQDSESSNTTTSNSSDSVFTKDDDSFNQKITRSAKRKKSKQLVGKDKNSVNQSDTPESTPSCSISNSLKSRRAKKSVLVQSTSDSDGESS